MFSYRRAIRSSTLNQTKDYWSFQNGARIIEFLTALDQIGPSLDCDQQPSLGSLVKLPSAEINCPLDRFMDDGNERLFETDFIREEELLCGQLSQGTTHEYATHFVTSVFKPEYEDCNFVQALTAMDYLADIENNRKRRLPEVAIRLGITRDTWNTVLAGDFDAWDWVRKIQERQFIIDGFYAKVFINLRIWIMVAELKQLDFNKANVFALLNTLFPPCVKDLPNEKVMAKAMYKYRAVIYRYVVDVENGGPRALDPFVARHLRPGTGCSWPETKHQLERYLELALSITRQVQGVNGIQALCPTSLNGSGASSSRGTSISSGRLRTNSSAHCSFDSTLPPSEVPTTPGSTICDGASVRSELRRRPRKKAEGRQNGSVSSSTMSNIPNSLYLPSVLMSHEIRPRRKPSETRFPVRVSTASKETACSRNYNQDAQYSRIEHYNSRSSDPISTVVYRGSVEHATRPDLGNSYPRNRKTPSVTGCLLSPSSCIDNSSKRLASEQQSFLTHMNRTGSASRFPVIVPPSNTVLCNTGRYRKFSNTTDHESSGGSVQQVSLEVEAFMRTAVSTMLDRRIPSQRSNRAAMEDSFQPTQVNPMKESNEFSVLFSSNPACPAKMGNSSQTRLPSDNMAFLKKPYDSAMTAQVKPVVKKKASITNFYIRSSAAVSSLKKNSSTKSLKVNASISATVEEHPMTRNAVRSETESLSRINALGIILSPVKALTELEKFPRYSCESSPTVRPIIRNQSSFDYQEKSSFTLFSSQINRSAQLEIQKPRANLSRQSSQNTMPFEVFPGEQQKTAKRPTLKKTKSFVIERNLRGKSNVMDEEMSHSTLLHSTSHTAATYSTALVSIDSNRKLNKKTSLSTLFSRSQNPDRPTISRSPPYFKSSDSRESVLIARPKIRNAKSFSSLRATNSQKFSIKESCITSGQPLKNPSSTRADMSLKSDDMNENLVDEMKMAFNSSGNSSTVYKASAIVPTLKYYREPLDYYYKEYTRQWLIEDSKSRKNQDLNPPTGRPLEFMANTGTCHTNGMATEIAGEEEVGGSIPKATRKPLPRPERFRVDSIFPLKAPEKKIKRLRFKEIDTSKWDAN